MKGNIDAVCCVFKYSGVGAVLVAIAAAATLALVVVVPLDAAVRGFLALYVAALAAHAHRKLLRVRAVRVDAERGIRIEYAAGEVRAGRVRDGCFVAPWLTIVRWRPPGALFDRTVLILPGMARAEDFRALRVILRFS